MSGNDNKGAQQDAFAQELFGNYLFFHKVEAEGVNFDQAIVFKNAKSPLIFLLRNPNDRSSLVHQTAHVRADRACKSLFGPCLLKVYFFEFADRLQRLAIFLAAFQKEPVDGFKIH